MTQHFAYLAMTRFAYGADSMSRASLLSCTSRKQAQQWLLNQLKPLTLTNPTWTSEQAIMQFTLFKQAERADKAGLARLKQSKIDTPNLDISSAAKAFEGYKATRKKLIENSKLLAETTALTCIDSRQPLQAKLLDFFSNHFSVSSGNLAMTLLAPTLETEAIAPHLTHTFSDMLVAVVQHPAMIKYLDNERSIGPNSKVGIRQRKKNPTKAAGLNENLAREILELHTLGVNGGYTQQDVLGLAKALTGWSIGSVKREERAGYKFRPHTHEPGTHQVLGVQYAESTTAPETQGIAILSDLVMRPQTANFICSKLVQHFIADDPPAKLVASMSATWMATQGHIPSVMQALIDHPLSWEPESQKYKTPREFVISACRACAVNKPKPRLFKTLHALGHGLFEAGSPAGYADEQSAWLSTSALNSRIEWTYFFAQGIAQTLPKGLSPVVLAQQALGPFLTARTQQYIQRAESKQQGIALLLLSPEFQRR